MMKEMTHPETSATGTPMEASRSPRFVPAVDIYETADEYVILAEMPGCDPKGIEVQYVEGELSIYGRVNPRPIPERGWLEREFEVGDYGRVFNVTESIDQERISADYEQGILTLRLPKAEASRPRKIEVRGK